MDGSGEIRAGGTRYINADGIDGGNPLVVKADGVGAAPAGQRLRRRGGRVQPEPDLGVVLADGIDGQRGGRDGDLSTEVLDVAQPLHGPWGGRRALDHQWRQPGLTAGGGGIMVTAEPDTRPLPHS